MTSQTLFQVQDIQYFWSTIIQLFINVQNLTFSATCSDILLQSPSNTYGQIPFEMSLFYYSFFICLMQKNIKDNSCHVGS